jgi:hypothetical protein
VKPDAANVAGQPTRGLDQQPPQFFAAQTEASIQFQDVGYWRIAGSDIIPGRSLNQGSKRQIVIIRRQVKI